jgi:hypothetical protein
MARRRKDDTGLAFKGKIKEVDVGIFMSEILFTSGKKYRMPKIQSDKFKNVLKVGKNIEIRDGIKWAGNKAESFELDIVEVV